MEPNSNKFQNKEGNEKISSKENMSLERQNKFLSLRKNKRMKVITNKTEDDIIKEKYGFNQNSYDASNNVIQNFFNSQEKTAFLFDLINSTNFSSLTIENCDVNLIKFMIVQSTNYYKSEEENGEALKKFFTNTIVTNLIDIMNIFKQDNYIVYNISNLLENLTYYSNTITKLITLNISSVKKIFECLAYVNFEVATEILKLIYDCYITDEEAVNSNINIGIYVFESLNKFISENDVEKQKIFLNSPYFKELISFVDLLINDNTKETYKKLNSDYKNNIIYVLLVLSRDTMDENLKLDAHSSLKKMLDIIIDEKELDVKKFGLCEIVNTFLPHIKMESNSPDIVLYSLQILDKFSYLCDTLELIQLDLINQIEQILITIIDMSENRDKPKFYYNNFTKAIIGEILSSISYIISNAIADYEDPDTHNDWEDYIINQTKIIEYFTKCLKINDLDEESLVIIYGFFKDFLESGIEKERFMKLILANFVEIGLIESLKNNIFTKKNGVIKEILEISLMMLKKADKLKGTQDNFIKIYLEKKGFDELLNNIESLDFGNSSNSELARNMQETFFK